MTPSSSRSRAPMIIAASALAVLIAASAVIATSSDDRTGAGAKTPFPRATSTVGASSRPTVTTSARATTSASTRAVQPPAAGLYRYRFAQYTISGGQENERSEVITIRVDPARRVGGAWQQLQHTTYSGSTQATLQEWLPDRVMVISTIRNSTTCTYTDPLLHYRLPLRVGMTWEPGPGVCDEGGQGSYAGAGGSTTVLRREKIRIGGVTVDAFVLSTTAHSATDEYRANTVLTTWFAPAYRLVVKAHQEQQVSTTAGSGSSTYDQTLLSLTPSR